MLDICGRSGFTTGVFLEILRNFWGLHLRPEVSFHWELWIPITISFLPNFLFPVYCTNTIYILYKLKPLHLRKHGLNVFLKPITYLRIEIFLSEGNKTSSKYKRKVWNTKHENIYWTVSIHLLLLSFLKGFICRFWPQKLPLKSPYVSFTWHPELLEFKLE